MSAYKFIMGGIMVIICMIAWIPMNETISNTRDIVNSEANMTETIERNNMIASLFNYSLFFVIVAYAIWVLKSVRDRQEEMYE